MTGRSIVQVYAAPGQVLRNAELAEQSQRLGRPTAAGTGVPQLGPEHVLARAQEELASAQLRYEEEFRRGYEQGVDEGGRQASESMMAAALDEARILGLNQGTEAGLRAAQEAAAEARDDALATLERMLAAMPEQMHARLAALEDDMVTLCFQAVTRVLGATGATTDGLRAMLAQALAQYGARQLVEVRLHPDDLQLAARDEVIGEWLRQRASGDKVQLVADGSISLGGVVLRSPAGRLDARLETQLDGLRHALLSVRTTRANIQAHVGERPASSSLGEAS
jgi:flagellar biosynthesis/type III secretory pathway protein FliH